MFALFVSVLAALFSVVNPIGAVPLFLGLTPDDTAAERNTTAWHTSLWFILILLAFFFLGTSILSFFGITVSAIRVAGGIIIMSSGYSLLQGKFAESRAVGAKVKAEALQKDDISFSPLAMPMLSGPGSISLLIGLYATNEGWPERFVIAAAVVLMGGLIYLTLRLAPMLRRVLGLSGLRALSRIMGFLVLAIGIQLLVGGIVALVADLPGRS